MISLRATSERLWGVRFRIAFQLLGATIAVLLLCSPLFSQGSSGRILGTITDQSGGVISGATVTVVDTDRGITRTLTTDDAGAFNAPNLTPGAYTVRVEAQGFKKLERQNIVLEVGKEIRVDLTVQPGSQTQTLTITESIPLVETTNATMGGTLENADIVDLPLNGRDYQNLLGLRPGVMLQPGGGPWTQSTNGVRPDESVWMVEGVFNSNPFDARPIIGFPSPFTDAATILPVDAIQEFNVMENPKAEYGWKAGAVVNVGVKSGTNQLHGTGYAFGRYDGWDARNYFNIGPSGGTCPFGGGAVLSVCAKTPAELKQFGGVVGGPIKKDKLFFFAGYEGLRSLIGAAVGASTPATGSLGGDPAHSMVDAIQALQTAGTPRSAVTEKLLGCTEPTATTAACTGGAYAIASATGTTVLSTFPNTNVSDNGVAKIDYHPNGKNSISGLFFLGNYSATGEDHPFLNVAFTNSTPVKTWTDTVSWIYTPKSTLVNEMRFGYTRTTFDFINLDVNIPADGKGYPVNTGVTNKLAGGLPNIAVGGGFNPLGTAVDRPQYYTPNPTYNFQDGISYLKGKHGLKFGFEYAHMEADADLLNNARGTISFGSLENFFAGTPLSGSIHTGDPTIRLTWKQWAGYAQDDWRITPKLILNVGLRYEYFTPLKEAHNNWANFDPTKGMVQPSSGNAIWNGDKNGLEPRLGFAYDVNGKGTTVVRGGASLIHSSFVLTDFIGAFGLDDNRGTSPGAIPTAAVITCGGAGLGLGESACPATGGGTIGVGSASFSGKQLCWDPAFACAATQPTVFPSAVAQCGDALGGAPSPCDLLGVDPHLKSPFTVNYNLSIQHQIGSNLSLEVGYVGNHGYRLLQFADINQAPAGAAYCLNSLTAAQLADACKGGPLTVGNASPTALHEARPYFTKFPYLGFINYMTNRAHSRYDSIQATLNKRMSHGLSFIAGYTFGRGLDNGSLNRFGPLPQDSSPAGIRNEYASSDFDLRHRLTVTATYNIPGRHGFGQLMEGWQLNTIVTYQTALPWMTWDGVQPGPPGNGIDGTGDNSYRWNISGPASSFPSGKVGIPYCSGYDASGGAAGASCVIGSVFGNLPAPSIVNPAACSSLVGSLTTAATLNAFGCYVSTDGKAVLAPPALGTFGNMGRNILRDSGFKEWDMSLFKNWTFKERYGIQFRAEVFNMLNHPIGANPYGAGGFVNANNGLQDGAGFGSALATPDFIAGNPLIGSGSQRVMQLGLKIKF
jgi:hypothetical protein